jgi:CBS-domain-containing membrane protein
MDGRQHRDDRIDRSAVERRLPERHAHRRREHHVTCRRMSPREVVGERREVEPDDGGRQLGGPALVVGDHDVDRV